MWRYVLPSGQVLNVEASNQEEASTRMLLYLRENGIKLQPGARIAAPTRVNEFQVKKGETFVPKGPVGESLPENMTVPGTNTFGAPDLADRELTVSSPDLISAGLADSLPGTGASSSDPEFSPDPGTNESYTLSGPFDSYDPYKAAVEFGTGTGVDPVFLEPNLTAAAFYNALQNRGLNPEGVLGSTFRGQAGLFNNLQNIEQALDAGRDSTNKQFFSGSGPTATQDAFERSLGQGNMQGRFANLLSQIETKRNDPRLASLLTGDPNENEEQFNALRDLVRNSVATRIGAQGARMLGSDARFRREFDRRAVDTGEQKPDFLTFAKSFFGA